MNKITLTELAEGLARRKGITKKDAETFVRNIFDIVEQALQQDKAVKIKGLGTFKLIAVESRESVDVNTGERIVIQGHARVTFTPDAVLRDQVNKPFADFQTVTLNEGTDIAVMESSDFPLEPLPPLPPELEEATEEQSVKEEPEQEDATATEAIPANIEDNEKEDQKNPNEPIETTEAPDHSEPQKQSEEPQESIESAEATAPQPATETQHVAQQTVQELTVETQHIEHQTIQQVTPPKQDGIHLSWAMLCACLFFVLCFIIGSFECGIAWERHSSPGTPPKNEKVQQPAGQSVETQKHQSTTTATDHPSTSKTPQQASPADSLARLRKQAVNYAQVEGGEWLIVGTREEHEMKPGDQLYKLARKHYGNSKMAVYIIRHNNIKNPDNVLLGTKLKIPEVVKKE